MIIICKIVLILVIFALFIGSLYQYISLPVVQFSYSSENCVGIIQQEPQSYSCNSLPEKYHHEYVK